MLPFGPGGLACSWLHPSGLLSAAMQWLTCEQRAEPEPGNEGFESDLVSIPVRGPGGSVMCAPPPGGRIAKGAGGPNGCSLS